MKEKIKTFYKKNQEVIDWGTVLVVNLSAIATIVYLTKYIKGQEIVAVGTKTVNDVDYVRILFKSGALKTWELGESIKV